MRYDSASPFAAMLDDPMRRKAALEYFGAPPEPETGEDPDTLEPAASLAPRMPARDDSFDELASRYLAAENADRHDAVFDRAGAGLAHAAQTINAGAGFDQPSMPTTPRGQSRTEAVGDLARIKALGAKATAKATTSKPQKSTDPNSPESKRAQGQVKDLLGDNISPETLATMSEADAESILKYGTAKAQRGLQAHGQDLTDSANKNTDARVKDRTKQDDVHFWAKLGQDAELAGQSLEVRKYIADQALKAAQAARDEAAATKEKDKADAVNVPGFEPTPDSSPTPKDAETLKVISQANNELLSSVSALRDLHRRHGPSYAGEAGTQTKQVMTAIKLAAKTIADLGALSGPDMGLMDALAGGDPSTIESVAKSTFGVDNTDAAMEGLTQWAQRRIAAAAKARGYKPKDAKPTRATPDKVLPKDAAGNLTLDAPVERRQYSPSLNRTRVVDASGKVLRTEDGDTRRGR
jgi:hypothetical protein